MDPTVGLLQYMEIQICTMQRLHSGRARLLREDIGLLAMSSLM